MKKKRLAGLIVGGLLVITAAACYLHSSRQNLPLGTGPAGPPIPATDFSRLWSEKSFLLVGLGDSVTAGFGARRGYAYFDRLVKNPPQEVHDMTGKCLQVVLPHLQFTNLAVSGTTSGEHIAHQLAGAAGR